MWVDREYTQHELDYINGLRRENERLKIANVALDVDKSIKYIVFIVEKELEELKKDIMRLLSMTIKIRILKLQGMSVLLHI